MIIAIITYLQFIIRYRTFRHYLVVYEDGHSFYYVKTIPPTILQSAMKVIDITACARPLEFDKDSQTWMPVTKPKIS